MRVANEGTAVAHPLQQSMAAPIPTHGFTGLLVRSTGAQTSITRCNLHRNNRAATDLIPASATI